MKGIITAALFGGSIGFLGAGMFFMGQQEHFMAKLCLILFGFIFLLGTIAMSADDFAPRKYNRKRRER